MLADFEQRVVDATFARLGKDAVYTPSGGQGIAVKVIPFMDDKETSVFGQAIVSDAQVFHIRVSQIAAPKAGDNLTYPDSGGTVFEINGVPKHPEDDPLRLIWAVEAVPIA